MSADLTIVTCDQKTKGSFAYSLVVSGTLTAVFMGSRYNRLDIAFVYTKKLFHKYFLFQNCIPKRINFYKVIDF